MFPLHLLMTVLAIFVMCKSMCKGMGTYVDWNCEASAPCVRASRPEGGIGDAGANVKHYSLEVMVHRRQNNARIRQWWAQQREPTWNIVIRWYRLLGTKVRVPISSCRNNLDCVVSLMGEDDVQKRNDDVSVGRMFAYRHFYVEVQYEGHPSISSVEIIIRKELAKPTFDGQPYAASDTVRGNSLNSDNLFSSNDISVGKGDSASVLTNVVQKRPTLDALAAKLKKGEALGALPKRVIPQLDDAVSDDHDDDSVVTEHVDVLKPNPKPLIPDEEEDVRANVAGGNDEYDNNDSYDFWDTNLPIIGKADSSGNKHIKNLVNRFGVGGLVGIVLGSITGLALLVFLCCYYVVLRRRSKRKGNTIKLPADYNNDRRSLWRRLTDSVKRKGDRRYPYPRHGKKVNKKHSYTSLTTDASDDEEIYSSGQRKPRISTSMVSDTLEGIRRKSTGLGKQAKRAFSYAKDQTTSFKEHPKEFVEEKSSFFWRCLGVIRAWFIRCCGGRTDADYRVLPESNDDDSDDDDNEDDSLLSHIGPSAGPPKPIIVNPYAYRKSDMLTPSAGSPNPTADQQLDSSGRYIVHQLQPSKSSGTDRKTEGGSTTPRNCPCTKRDPESVGIKIVPVHLSSPRRKCGLRCVQKGNCEHSDSTNATRSSAAPSVASAGDRVSETTSVTSETSDVNLPQRNTRPRPDLSVGDAPVTTECPPLPKVLRQTKQGFRRENQRMAVLMKRFERRASSCVVIDETLRRDRQHQQKYVTMEKNDRRAVSVGGRFLDINHPSTSSKIPPRLLHRRSRISRPIVRASKSSSDESKQNDPMTSSSYRTKSNITVQSTRVGPLPSPLRKPYSLTSPHSDDNRSSVHTSIHTSEIDELISDGSVSISTNKIDVSSSSDEQSTPLEKKPTVTILRSSTCEMSSNGPTNISATHRTNDEVPLTINVLEAKSQTETTSILSRSSTSLLQSAAQAFLTSDDDIISNDDDYYNDEFWSHCKK